MISVDRLSSLSIFSQVGRKSLERLAQDIEEVMVSPQEVILTEGEMGDRLFLIASGSVRVDKKIDRDGLRFKTLARLEKEEFFGEMSFIDRSPSFASVIALEPTTLYVISRESLEKINPADSRTALDQLMVLLSGMSSKLRWSSQELITVFEISRILVQESDLAKSISLVLNQIQLALNSESSLAFYRWNEFNDEYTRMSITLMEPQYPFPDTLEKGLSPTLLSDPTLTCCLINNLDKPEGILVVKKEKLMSSAERQLLETISAILGPSLTTSRLREEEQAKRRFDERRQQGYYQ